jgi:hypothetical protein
MKPNRTVRRMALATAIALALAPAAQAATFTVTNADDDGAGSLRAALAAANITAGPDTVEFDSAFFAAATPRTIALVSPLSITDSIIVNGPGADIAALDGQQNVRIVLIEPAVPGIAVEIRGLTMQDGFGGNGAGCVRAMNTHLLLEDSVLTGCAGGEGTGGALLIVDAQVPPPSPMRKGVLQPPASLTVRDTRFTNNRAIIGGAIAAQLLEGGDVRLESATLDTNEAVIFGGGADFRVGDGEIVLQDSTISGNLAHNAGAGFSVITYGDVRVENSVVSGNRIEIPSYSYGLYSYGAGAALGGLGNVLITGTSFEDNAIVAVDDPPTRKGIVPEDYIGIGGGLFVFPANAGRSLSIVDSHFLRNGAGIGGGATVGVPPSSGGGAKRAANGRWDFTQKTRNKAFTGTNAIGTTRFTDNRGGFGGSGLAMMLVDPQIPPTEAKAVDPGMTLDRVTLSGNLLTEDAPLPSALLMLGSAWPVQLINSTLSDNGGGILIAPLQPPGPAEPVLLLDHSTITDNDVGGVIATLSVPVEPKRRGRLGRLLAHTKDYPAPQVSIAIRNSVLSGNGDEIAEADLIADPASVEMLHSLVGTTEPPDFTGFDDQGGNQFGAAPLLAPLALAGHAYLEVRVPQTGSPLIDAGDPDVAAATPPAIDERGLARIAGTAIDIGAVETVPPGSIAFDPAALTVSETDGTATLTAVRTGGTGGAVDVTFTTADGSAVAGQDYTAAGGTLSWADGEDGAKSFVVALTDDALVEADEIFTAVLSAPTGGATLGAATATVTLTSDDVPPVGTIELQTLAVSVDETAGTVTLNVARTGGSNGAVTVDFATADATAAAASDYTATSGTLTWESGDTAVKTVVVPILDDALVENPETFQLTLSNATGGAGLGAASGTVTIVSDDVPPPGTLAITPTALSVNEPAGTATLSVARTGGSAGEVSVTYTTTAGSAAAGSDFTAANGSLTWADGDTAAKSIVVPILDDTEVEADEQFSVTIAQPTGGASLGASAATVTIVSEDVAPVGTMQFDGIGTGGMVTWRFNENGTPALAAKAVVQVAVTRTGGSAGAASIDFATADGTAVAPGDYTATSGTLNWADGESGARFIPVNLVEDGLPEPDENFRIVLSNAQGAGLGINGQAELVIVANGGAVNAEPLTIPAGDARGWLTLLGAMLAAAWAGLRRRD